MWNFGCDCRSRWGANAAARRVYVERKLIPATSAISDLQIPSPREDQRVNQLHSLSIASPSPSLAQSIHRRGRRRRRRNNQCCKITNRSAYTISNTTFRGV